MLRGKALVVVACCFSVVACVPGVDPSKIAGNLPTNFSGENPSGGVPHGGGTGENGYINPNGNGPGNETGYVSPSSLLFCGETGQIVLQKNQTALLNWNYPPGYTPSQALQFSLESTPAGIADVGTITSVSLLSARYQAPAHIPAEATIGVRAVLGDATTPAVCTVRLIPDTDLGIPDDGTTRGAVGNVFVLPVNIPLLPDFALMTPVSQILVPNFDVPTRAFDSGFPGVEDLFEWFGIRFEGRILIPADGVYFFRLTSDDGANFWIDGTKVIDNDGVHAPRTVDGTATLTAGPHPFRLDYYQGPRYLIALELFWKAPGESSYSIIAPDYFARPAP